MWTMAKPHLVRSNFFMFENFDLVILTETWLTPDIKNNPKLGITNRMVCRLDMNNHTSNDLGWGGGAKVLIAIKS